MLVNKEISQRASGRVKCLVINRDGSVAREYPWQSNLILNAGLNSVCQTLVWADQFLYSVIGTGTTETAFASGTGNNGSGSVTTFTGPGGFDFTTNSAVGDMIKMTSGASSGTEVRITTVTDATHVQYTPSGTVSSGEFTVYRTSQTGLTTETKRTANYLTGAGNCGGTLSGSVVSLKRTYDHTAEGVGGNTYWEIGFSNVVGAGSNLFSRIKLASSIPVLETQALRVVYVLNITITPTTSQSVTFNITNWPVAPATDTNGVESVIQPGLSGINTTGVTNPNGYNGTVAGGNSLEPSVSSSIRIWLSTSSAALTTFAGSNANRSAGYTAQAVTLNSYTALDFFRDKSTTFATGSANSTLWRSMGLANNNFSNYADDSTEAVFDQAQTKDSLHTLTLTWRIRAGRTLA